MGNKHICLPFASEVQYRECVDDPAQYRQYLAEMLSQYPELFPQEMDQGFTFHDCYVSIKQELIMRRIKLITTGAVFTLRPSFVMPYMIAHQEGREVEANNYWHAYLALDPAGPWAEVIRDPQAHASPCGWQDFPPSSSESLMGVQVEAREHEIPPAWGQPTEVTFLSLETEPYKVAQYSHGVITLSHLGEIMMMGALEGFKGTSAKGIAIGSTAEHIRERYGPPSRVLPRTQRTNWVYDAHGIVFQLHDDRVVSWWLF